MKKMTKRVLALLMVLTMLLTAIPTSAGSVTVDIPKKAGCMRVAPNDKQMMSYGTMLGTVIGTDKVTVKSSNKKVVTVKKLPMGMPGEKGFIIDTDAKKNGTAIITVKVGKKTYKCKYTMCNYKNPITSIQVGKYKISGKSFNKTAHNKSLRYSKLAGKNTKVQVKLKRGWKVEQIFLNPAKPTGGMVEPIQNGGSFKIAGGRGTNISITAYDTKTGIRNYFELTLR